MKFIKIIVLYIGICFSLPAYSTGYYLGEHDAVSAGRGLAVTAKLEEASTIFFNPAGLGFLSGLNLAVGGTILFPSFSYKDPEGKRPSSQTLSETTMTPHMYVSYTFKEKAAIGVGMNSPFGMSLKWPVGFAGEHESAGVDMKVPNIYIVGAYRPIPQLSFGVALRIIPATIETLKRFKLVTDSGAMEYGYVDMAASAVGVGATFGVTVRPMKKLHLGASYLSRVKLNFKNGEAHFGLPYGFSDTSIFHDQGGSTSFTLPDIISFGIGYDVLDNLYIEGDINYTLWSVYKELQIKFNNDPSGKLSTSIPKNWKDVPCFRLGGEYTIKESFTIRLAGGYDMSPVPPSTVGPDLPDSNRFFIGFGGSYLYKPLGLKLSAAYTFVRFIGQTTGESNPFQGNYKGMVSLISFTMGVNK